MSAIVYLAFFRRETFFKLNRVYLLSILMLSLILPGISINWPVQPDSGTPYVNNFTYVEETFVEVNEVFSAVEIKASQSLNSSPYILYLYMLGVAFSAIFFTIRLFVVLKNILVNDKVTDGKIRYVLLDRKVPIHSFFNFIFVHKSGFDVQQQSDVIAHEQAHARLWHSVDLLVVEIFSVLQWFNPFIFIIKRALVETHEFQADQAVINSGSDKIRYQQLLLYQASSSMLGGLTSNFNQSIIKTRLKMINKERSKGKRAIKYISVIPLVLCLGVVIAISQSKIDNSLVRVINYSQDGETIIGESDFAILDLPEDNIVDFYADEMLHESGVVRMSGNVKLESAERNWEVNAANIVINNATNKLYAFTDDYIPSILPIEEGKYQRISSGFGMRMHPILKMERMHNGVDFSAETGTPVRATANGTIRAADFKKSYGNRVIIDHGNGFSTSYNQLQSFIVKENQTVKKGDVIGYVGSTGLSTAPHLHYEIMKDGKYVDPEKYFEDC